MAEMVLQELSRVWQDLARAFAHLLPRLLVLLIVAVLGWAVAALLRKFLRGVLRLVKFDRLSDKAGASRLLKSSAMPSPSELVSHLVFWCAWIGFLLLGISALGIAGLQPFVARFFVFLPRFFAALVTLFLGLLAASFFSRAILLAAVNANAPSPQLISTTTRVVIMILAVSMAFEEVGLAQHTILIAFSIIVGALMFGLALAFGIGGSELAKQFLERHFATRNKAVQEKEVELPPL